MNNAFWSALSATSDCTKSSLDCFREVCRQSLIDNIDAKFATRFLVEVPDCGSLECLSELKRGCLTNVFFDAFGAAFFTVDDIHRWKFAELAQSSDDELFFWRDIFYDGRNDTHGRHLIVASMLKSASSCCKRLAQDLLGDVGQYDSEPRNLTLNRFLADAKKIEFD
jgi:hypothetical protein